jgi:hypothetical protein
MAARAKPPSSLNALPPPSHKDSKSDSLSHPAVAAASPPRAAPEQKAPAAQDVAVDAAVTSKLDNLLAERLDALLEQRMRTVSALAQHVWRRGWNGLYRASPW